MHAQAMLKNRFLPVLAGAALVVAGLNTVSYAADGHLFRLGRSNSESHPATVHNSGGGPALRLQSGQRSPALAVSNTRLVRHLNADEVDGKSAASLATSTLTFTVAPGTALPFTYVLAGVPKGRYLGTFDMVLRTTTTTAVCFFVTRGIETGVGYGAISNGFSAPSASALLTRSPGRPLEFTCNSATSVWEGPGFPSTITLTRVDRTARGSLTAVSGSRAGAPGR